MHPEGFDPELFVSVPQDDFICAICTHVFKDPVQCKNEHVFCEDCLNRCLTDKPVCPVCQCALIPESVQPISRFMKTEMSKLRMRCPSAQLSALGDCAWEGCLGELQQHRNTCPLEPVPCLFGGAVCKERPRRAHLQRHMAESTVEHAEAIQTLVHAKEDLEAEVQALRQNVAGVRGPSGPGVPGAHQTWMFPDVQSIRGMLSGQRAL